MFIAPANTGVASGFDLDNDGTVGGPDDAFGFGEFPGQHGMVMLSRFPIVDDEVRTFQHLLWASMPGARLPDDPATPEPADWYTADELAVLPLSSKSHWDVPIDVDGRDRPRARVASDTRLRRCRGPQRAAQRRRDRFWADYVAGNDIAWIVDDAGATGGLDADAEFVIVGDLNSDPVDGDSRRRAIRTAARPRQVQDPPPASDGRAPGRRRTRRGANAVHAGDPGSTPPTSPTTRTGNLRVDYVLPSDGFDNRRRRRVLAAATDELAVSSPSEPPASSDHRLVWVDLA